VKRVRRARPWSKGSRRRVEEALCTERDAAAAGKSADDLRLSLDTLSAEVGRLTNWIPLATFRRCNSNPVDTRVESAWFQRSKLAHDNLLSSFAFKFNLHHYTTSSA